VLPAMPSVALGDSASSAPVAARPTHGDDVLEDHSVSDSLSTCGSCGTKLRVSRSPAIRSSTRTTRGRSKATNSVSTSSSGRRFTSASDGQRFALPRRVLQQTYSTCFSDFALEFYTFLADNYAPFHSMPIECTDRDAAFVLDGLLYNESDLEIEEHYTDTN
jgi:hypothetical protein